MMKIKLPIIKALYFEGTVSKCGSLSVDLGWFSGDPISLLKLQICELWYDKVSDGITLFGITIIHLAFTISYEGK